MKKIVSLLLCVLMIVGLFAGCNTEQPAGTTAGNQPAGTTGTTAPATTADDGRSAPGELPIVTDGSKPVITIGIRQNALTEDFETNAYTLWLEEQTGIDLQFKLYAEKDSDAVTQLNLDISGGVELPDILWHIGLSKTEMDEYGNDGVFIDQTPYFDQYGYYLNQAFDFMRAQGVEDDIERIWMYGKDPASGNIYGFPDYTNGSTDGCVCGYINQDWLKAVGKEMPTTVEELYDVLVAFRDEDPNGNGEKDEIPLVYRDGGYRANITEWLINAFIFCSDQYFFNATDGQLWVPYTTDEYRQALIYMNKLYQEGLFSPMSWTMTSDAELKALTSVADGFTKAGVVGGHPTLTLDTAFESVKQYVAWPVLKDATGKGGYASIRSNSFNYRGIITADCDDPELAFRLLDFMTSQDSALWQRFGRKGIDWEYAAEGAITTMGNPAAVNVLDLSVYTSQNNINWHVAACTVRPSNMIGNATDPYNPEDLGSYRRFKIYLPIYQNTIAAGQPEEVVYTLLYNEAENEVLTEVQSQVKDYMKEARALFISGAMDPNKDADWNAYLAAMENQGLSQWLEVAQAAYDRMGGK